MRRWIQPLFLLLVEELRETENVCVAEAVWFKIIKKKKVACPVADKLPTSPSSPIFPLLLFLRWLELEASC